MNTAALVNLLTVAALATIMVAMGLEVCAGTVLASARPVWRVLAALVANYLLVPAVTVGLLYLFQTEPMVSVGFLILSVCPGAPVGPPATAVARGNVAWSIGMMVILAGLSALLSPALLSLMLNRLALEGGLRVDYLAIVRILMIGQLLPLTVGLAVGHWAPGLSQRIVRPIRIVANLLLLVLVGLILATHYEMLSAIQARGWFGMGLLFAASFIIGCLCGGMDAGVRRASAVTTAARNAAVGLAIVASSFADTPAVTAVVAYGLVSILATFGCALLIGKSASAAA